MWGEDHLSCMCVFSFNARASERAIRTSVVESIYELRLEQSRKRADWTAGRLEPRLPIGSSLLLRAGLCIEVHTIGGFDMRGLHVLVTRNVRRLYREKAGTNVAASKKVNRVKRRWGLHFWDHL